jgi:hypothetical protein
MLAPGGRVKLMDLGIARADAAGSVTQTGAHTAMIGTALYLSPTKALAADPDVQAGASTIRNELAVLEERGLLAHPHTSAGRVPTDAGYRYFVDRLLPARREPRAELQAGARAVLQAPAHLHGNGDRDRLGHGPDDCGRTIGLAETRCPGARLRHLLDRAAEVDVHEVGPCRLHHARGFGHRRRVAAEDLDRKRMLVGSDPEIPERALVAVLEPSAADHFRAHESGPVPAPLAAKCLHAHTCHRGKDDARRDLDVADSPGCPQIYLHRAGKGSEMPVDVVLLRRYHARLPRRPFFGPRVFLGQGGH